MVTEATVFQFIQWAEKTGIIPAGTAVMLVVFCAIIIWLGKRQSSDFKAALEAQRVAHDETVGAVREQVQIQSDHLSAAEKRYELLRADMNLLRDQVNETYNDVWKEVIQHLRNLGR